VELVVNLLAVTVLIREKVLVVKVVKTLVVVAEVQATIRTTLVAVLELFTLGIERRR
jgi:hypothetical protein